ncbi:MAG: metal-sulfur cluster assembly factor [Candidatus Baltobacteraceae bacterium]
MPTVEEVRDVLREVEDPEIHMGIVDLGLVYGIDIAGERSENVKVTMTLTSPMCPVGPMFKESVRSAVAGMEGVESTDVLLTFDPPWDPREMASDDAKVQLGIW